MPRSDLGLERRPGARPATERPARTGPAQPGPVQTGPAQTGPVEPGSARPGTGQRGLGQQGRNDRNSHDGINTDRNVNNGARRYTPDRDSAHRDGVNLDAADLDGASRDGIGAEAGNQLAALIARAARAPSALVHFVEGSRLRIFGGHGLRIAWADVADLALQDTLAGVVVAGGRPLVINDVRADPRVPAGSPVRLRGLGGAYLGQPIRDESGAVLGVCCVLDHEVREWTDAEVGAVAEAAQVGTLLFTERRARHEVDRQRRFLDAVLDSLHDGVIACDADGRVVLANSRMQRLWGAERSSGNEALYRALRGERLRDEELVLPGRGRQTRYYLVDAQPIIGPGGQTLGAVQAVQDVTRRRRAERFRTCELAVVTALATAPTVEAAGPRVLEAVVGTLGWTHAELWLVDEDAGVIRSAASWHPPNWQADIDVPGELPYGTGLAGRAWQAGKPLWIRDVGRPQSLISPETAAASRLHTAVAIPVRNGLETLGVLTAFADTVEDPEDELVALMSGISAQIAQFIERRLVEDLQRQLTRTKNEYLALIGHELRTPLTSIAAYTELLREADAETLVGDGPRMLEVIDRNATQLRYIINELLELSALDTGHAAVQLSPVDLAGLVREAVECTRAAVDGEPVTIDDDLPAELVLPGDRKRLRQVVDNLLGNAVKYSPDGGRIAVTLRAAGRAAELTVSDTGIGVSPDEREKMFTGLYRTSRARDRAIPGSGLGLTLSRAVVQRHHGSIELTGHDGPGTTVLVRLPLDVR